MEIREFNYRKPGEVSGSKRKVLVLRETLEEIAGIDFTKLSEQEEKTITQAYETFQAAVSSVMGTAFRNFKQSNIS